MKKKILFLLILFLPFFINAEEKCEIISGNGKDIGSEIACGTEHFYIVENKEDSVRMLGKYNLYTGKVFNQITVSEERYNEIKELCDGASYCNAMFEEEEFKGYVSHYDSKTNDDGSYTYMVYGYIDEDEVKQDEKAIGAHGDSKDKPVYPEYGVQDIVSPMIGYNENLFGEPYGNNTFVDFNIYDLQNDDSIDSLHDILNDYNNYLNSKGYDIINFDMLSVKDIDNIIYKLTNEHLPLEEWAEDDWVEENSKPDTFYIVGSIKEYLPEGYEWLYSTTYWTRTTRPYLNDEGIDEFYSTFSVYFIATLGNLCNVWGCNAAIGAGIRPVIEISKSSINYNLITESEEGGTLEKVNETKVGDTIVLKPLAKAGYKLKGFTITTDSGQTIEIEEKDIFKNDDGTIIINPDVFVMPLENVIITARWGFTNPKTGVFDYISFILVGMFICMIGYISINYNNKRYEL